MFPVSRWRDGRQAEVEQAEEAGEEAEARAGGREPSRRKTRAAEAAERIARAERTLRESKAIRRDLPRFLERLSAGERPLSPVHSELDQLARLFATINKQKPNHYPLAPDAAAFQRLVEICWERTRLLRGRETLRFAQALLAALRTQGRGFAGRETGSREPITATASSTRWSGT